MSISTAETFLRNAKRQHSQTDINESVLRAIGELIRELGPPGQAQGDPALRMNVPTGALLGAAPGRCRGPERVSHLVLYGGFARGWRAAENTEKAEYWTALKTLIRQGWGQNNPAFRQVFTALFIPGANQQQMDWFNELQRTTVSP